MGTNRDSYDVAVIGAGVCGVAIARRLSAYNLSVVLVEKEADVSFGTSKANSGIVHGGFHHNKKYLKTQLEIDGGRAFDQLYAELGFPFKRCGILVAAKNEEEMKTVEHLYRQGVENGSIGIELCSRERMMDLEPKLHGDVIGGLHAPAGGIVEPYRFVFAMSESALKNGVELMTGFRVVGSEFSHNRHTIIAEDGRSITARAAINAAGVYADEVSKLFGGEEFQITPRKGEYHLLSKETEGKPSRVLFPVPSAVSKGMLVIPTVEGTVLIGPTAREIEDKENVDTTREDLDYIMKSAQALVPSISDRDVISSFAGLRPALSSGDFFIEISESAPYFIQVAGIQSPGLTAAPAIAERVKDLVKTLGISLTEKENYDPRIDRVEPLAELSPEELDEKIHQDPRYGKNVCRCEQVSEAEIVEAIRRGHTTLDGIKFFTRAGAGSCQGGFCTHRIIKIIQRETGLSYDEITKKGPGSEILTGLVGEAK